MTDSVLLLFILMLPWLMWWCLFFKSWISHYIAENCPDQNPRLKNWSPGKDTEKRVFIKKGDMFRLNSDATVHSIVIQDGGMKWQDEHHASVYCMVFTSVITWKMCWNFMLQLIDQIPCFSFSTCYQTRSIIKKMNDHCKVFLVENWLGFL